MHNQKNIVVIYELFKIVIFNTLCTYLLYCYLEFKNLKCFKLFNLVFELN